MEDLEDHKFTAIQLANSILESTIVRKLHTDLLKLMKLSYISVGYCLYFDFDPIEEDIEAWKYGPVIPSIWYEFKHNGINTNIDELGIDNPFENEPPTIEICDNNTNKHMVGIISYVVDRYKGDSGWNLVTKTHDKNAPWDKYYVEGKNNIIPKEDIKEYYKKNLQLQIM